MSTNAGLAIGNNTVGWTGFTDQRSHNHRGDQHSQVIEVYGVAHEDDVTHQHDVTGSAAWTPPYYALALIQYMGE